MPANPPRVVFVTRESDYELLIARRATRAQASFFLARASRGGSKDDALATLEARHQHLQNTINRARAAVPGDWRQAQVRRGDLDRFLFGPEDIVVAIGQDGLIANVAKYLTGQPVLGINPEPDLYDGVLVRVQLKNLPHLLLARGQCVEERTMVRAELDNGDALLALNEVFIGHRSHQSARYQLVVGGRVETQSSSGLIVASGTGMTGWARSIMEATHADLRLAPQQSGVAWFVREPFPSVATGTSLRCGTLTDAAVAVTSQMNEGGVIFADGIEQDFLAFDWGQSVTVRPADHPLNLVTDG